MEKKMKNIFHSENEIDNADGSVSILLEISGEWAGADGAHDIRH